MLIFLHHDFQNGAVCLRHAGIADSSHIADGALGCGVAYAVLWIQYGSVYGQALIRAAPRAVASFTCRAVLPVGEYSF